MPVDVQHAEANKWGFRSSYPHGRFFEVGELGKGGGGYFVLIFPFDVNPKLLMEAVGSFAQ